MQVEHKLNQGPVQPGHRPAQHGETRAGDLGREFGVESAQSAAQIDMIERFEIETRRLAPVREHRVVVFVAPVGDLGAGQVGHLGQQRAQRFVGLARLRFGALQTFGDVAQRGIDAGLGLIDSETRADQLPDRLARAFALGQQLLAVDIRRLAPRIEGFENRHVELKTAPGQRRSHAGGVFADCFDIEHASLGVDPGFSERLW